MMQARAYREEQSSSYLSIRQMYLSVSELNWLPALSCGTFNFRDEGKNGGQSSGGFTGGVNAYFYFQNMKYVK